MESFLDNQDISAATWNKWGLPTRNLSLRVCLEKKAVPEMAISRRHR